jgi:hypothetical protein
MEMNIQPSYIRLTILGVVLVLFVTACTYGFFAGRALARSELTVNQVRNVVKALNYFYSDQDRYPGQIEFAEPSIMRTYLTSVPAIQVLSTECPRPYAYETFDRKAYTVTFCVSRAFDGWAAGKHSTTEKDLVTW